MRPGVELPSVGIGASDYCNFHVLPSFVASDVISIVPA